MVMVVMLMVLRMILGVVGVSSAKIMEVSVELILLLMTRELQLHDKKKYRGHQRKLCCGSDVAQTIFE